MRNTTPNTVCRLSLFFNLVIFSSYANAQIVYTNVPDIASTGNYNLDLNNDGSTDFVISQTTKLVKSSDKFCKGNTGTDCYIRITPLNGNQVLDDNNGDVQKSGVNQTIDASSLLWNTSNNQRMGAYEWRCITDSYFPGWQLIGSGPWSNYYTQMDDGFLSLRLMTGSRFYYGWVRVSIPYGGSSFTVKDFAFNKTLDHAIFAGQASENYLGIGPLSFARSSICAGSVVAIPYTISGTFSASNIVIAELSDATGSFANPVALGNVVSNVSGNIDVLIPGLTPAGNAYRIHVRSTNPAIISSANDGDIYVENSGSPVATITASGTDICSGSYLEAHYGTCYFYQWKLNGNDILDANSYNYIPAKAGDYSCTIKASAGSVTSNTIKVTAQPAAYISADPTGIACGGPVHLMLSGTSGTYQWRLNSNDIPGATSYDYYATTNGNYSCVSTNICGAATSNTVAVSINPPMADATITAPGGTAGCSLSRLNANTGSGIGYQWNIYSDNSGWVPISGATNSFYDAKASGLYSVTEKNSAGCYKYSNNISVEIGTPTAAIYATSGSICKGNPVYLSAYLASFSYSYQWIKDGLDIPGATSYNYYAKRPGTYSVRISVPSGGCNSTSQGVTITNGCTSTKSTNNSSPEQLPGKEETLISLFVAPNPISATTTISFTLNQTEKVLLRVFDVNGKLVRSIAETEFSAGEHRLVWSPEGVGPGSYVLRLQTSHSMQTKKLIVIK